MQVMVNGESRELPDGSTVTALLETLQIAPERVVVEVNLKILKRAELAGRALQEGDRVEIVHFVGGGTSDIRHETGDMRPSAGPFSGPGSWSPVSGLRSPVS